MDWNMVWENYKYASGAYGDNVRMRDAYLVNLFILAVWTIVLVVLLIKTLRCNVVVRATVLKKESDALRGKYYIQYSHNGQNHEKWHPMKKGEYLNKDGTLTLRINPKDMGETFQYIHPALVVFMLFIYVGFWFSILLKFYDAIMMTL